MLKKYIYILIITFFIFSCSDLESQIKGDWNPSKASIAEGSQIDSELNLYHKKELIEKLSSQISPSMVYSFKDNGYLEISHFNNDEKISLLANWKIDSDLLIIDIDGQESKRYNLDIVQDTMTLDNQGVKTIFYRNSSE